MSELQKTLLKHQIELEESNLRYAVQLKKDYEMLYRLRGNIQLLKEELKELESTTPNKNSTTNDAAHP